MHVTGDRTVPHGLATIGYDDDGVATTRWDLVRDGVLVGYQLDRTFAPRLGLDRSNGCAYADSPHHVPLQRMANVSLQPDPATDRSTADLIAAVDDGIYITRVHYLGIVHPREGVLTGMTRDGTFRVRNGKIAEPLVNLRFTVAMPDLLRDVPALTRDVKLVNATSFYGERYPYGALVPALATTRFNVTGIGSAPGI
jgi:TldD protein